MSAEISLGLDYEAEAIRVVLDGAEARISPAMAREIADAIESGRAVEGVDLDDPEFDTRSMVDDLRWFAAEVEQ